MSPSGSSPAAGLRRLATAAIVVMVALTQLGATAFAQQEAGETLAASQELTAGYSRTLVNGEEDFLYTHTNLQVWEPLVRYDNNLRPQPGIAETWLLSPDGLVWTFNLRHDVVFSNGDPLVASDVLASIDHLKKSSGKPSTFLGGINFAEIYGDPVVTATDAYTVTFTYTIPRPLLPYSISNHYSPVWAAESFRPDGTFNGYPIGSGPFVLADWQRDQYIELVRNENYYGTLPHLSKIHLRQYSDATARLAALRSGEVQALLELGGVLPSQAAEIASDGEYDVRAHAATCNTFLAFNGSAGRVFNDVRLRQAVSLSIDRRALVDQLLDGYGTPATSVLLEPVTEFAVTDPAQQIQVDPERAAQLVQEATGGERVSAKLIFTPPAEGINAWPFPLMAAYFQGILQPLGFDLELQQLETTALTDARNAGDYDISISNNCWATGDPNYILGRLLESTSAQNVSQFQGYANPQVDALLAEGRTTLDPARRVAIYQEVQAIANTEVPVAPLFNQQTITAAGPTIRGLDQRVAYAPTFETVYIIDAQ
jgi:peptide/nickel transport system substrate-binding protein